MATTKKRLIITLPKATEEALGAVAKRDQMALSAKALAMLQDSLELEEDMAFGKIAEHRLKTNTKWLTHKEVWAKYKL